MSEQRLKQLAWLLLGLAVAFYAASLVLFALIPLNTLGRHSALWPVDLVNLALVFYAVIGAWIATRRPRNAIGWIFLWIGFLYQIYALTSAYVAYAKLVDPRLPVNNAALLLPGVMWGVAFLISPLLLLLFPDGRLPSPRWRPVLWLFPIAGIAAILTNGDTVEAGSFTYEIPALVIQLGMGNILDALQSVEGFFLLLIPISAAAALIVRLRRARGIEREQLKWICFAGIILAITQLIEILITGFFQQLQAIDPSAVVPADLFFGIPAALGFLVVPLAAAVAILRYRLYEIDVIIRRTLIYATLTGILALVYFGSVVLLEQVFRLLNGQAQSPVIIVLSTLAISALFAPLRMRLQDWIERRFYRRKYNAERVLARFGAAARSEVDLNQLTTDLLDVVNESMQPERVMLWMKIN